MFRGLISSQYGRVERLYINQERRHVYIKFTDQVSALRVSHLTSKGSLGPPSSLEICIDRDTIRLLTNWTDESSMGTRLYRGSIALSNSKKEYIHEVETARH